MVCLEANRDHLAREVSDWLFGPHQSWPVCVHTNQKVQTTEFVGLVQTGLVLDLLWLLKDSGLEIKIIRVRCKGIWKF